MGRLTRLISGCNTRPVRAMARSTRRDTDFNIRAALKRTRNQLLSAQESGRAAIAGYEELAPQYNQAVEKARAFQSTLTRDYESYQQDYNQAVEQFNRDLQSRKSAFESVVARGQDLETAYRSAFQTLRQLQASQQQAATTANQLYATYQREYEDAVSVAAKEYEKQLRSTRSIMYLVEYQANKAAPGSFRRDLKTREFERLKKEYEDLQADTGFVTRAAQEQTAQSLQSYQTYLSNTYNPSEQQLNQFYSTFIPAEEAFTAFRQSDAVSEARTNYESLAQDTGFVDRAASDTKAVYDASQEEYGRLQAAYEGMTPQLNQYTQQAETAKQQVLSLQGRASELQRSLAIDTEARKRGTRRDYRQSVLTGDFKRRGSAR